MIVYEKNGILTFSNIKVDEEKLEGIKVASILGDKELDNRFFKLVKEQKFTTGCYTFDVMFDAAKLYFTNHVEMRVLSEKFGTMPEYPMGGYNFKEKMAYISKYDKQNKNNITVSTYELLYPSITYFFAVYMNSHKKDYIKEEPVYLNRLVSNLDKDISRIVKILNGEESTVRQTLYTEYPEFAIFYYEIFPYLALDDFDAFDIDNLKELKKRTEQMKLRTDYIDEKLGYVTIAKNNSKVLNLLRRNDI